ncbi:mechanosensitive ion channel family protein [Moraxella osloensis]|uniref:Small-conductance mechanosensitive channel n=1 Tax=Moraxella tetraodonis TaxID=2767221 RepID=A0A9X2A584_9GAMM|nr:MULTISPECIES: mechanosensitive ion channel family protein [Moraxella]MCG8148727.1 mechanosensitive ion channel family protein [Moraxella tetraodonis]MDK1671141.1 mechanosensitive ion channel family protein [Moraxella osloensis]
MFELILFFIDYLPTYVSMVSQADMLGDKVNEYQTIMTSANHLLQQMISRIPYLIVASLVFVIFWVLSIFFKKAVTRILGSRKHHQNLVTVFRRVGSALILFLGFMVAMIIAVPSFTPGKLIGALGIGSVAIGFAFKDIFQNLLSGILLLLSEPFRIGDQIISGNFEGTVEDIQIRATTIRTYDGRKVVIPNSQLYTSTMTVNTAYSQRRLEFDVGIGYENNIIDAQQVILSVLKAAPTVSKLAEPSVIATALADSSVVLRVRWFIDDGTQTNRVASINEVIILVKEALEEANISIPFPITTLDTNHPLLVKIENSSDIKN